MPAKSTGLNNDSIPFLEMLDSRPYRRHHATRFMSRNQGKLHVATKPSNSFVIRGTKAAGPDTHKHLVWFRLRDRNILKFKSIFIL
jgi:hypothetical protein